LLAGCGGDSLASAVLANGITLVGRSFKYHRPRGFVAAGVEEPNALFTLGRNGRTTPNIVATTVELVEGLEARRQNGWPSVSFDLRAAFAAFAPLLGAGFYYKTFMGPKRDSWMFYEPFIRRAAGLGHATHEPDPDRYEVHYAHVDVLVIGGGPAGLAAAVAAAASGTRVLVVEQDRESGGGILQGPVESAEEHWRRQALAQLEGAPNAQLMTRTTALGLYDDNMVTLLQRRDHLAPSPESGEAREVVTVVQACAIVFATGALERPLVFADNDRPGVMLASAARNYLNRYAVLCGERAVIATNNDKAWITGLELAAAGAHVTMVDERHSISAELREQALTAGLQLRLGERVLRALGRRRVRGAVVGRAEGGEQDRLQCDLLCMSGGFSPVVHLTSHTGIKPIYRAELDAFVPGGFAAGHFAAGALLGPASWEEVLSQASAAGREAARHAGATVSPDPISMAGGAATPGRESPAHSLAASIQTTNIDAAKMHATTTSGHSHSAPGRSDFSGKAFVDFQTDVTTADLDIAHQEGFESVEHLKRYTTLGMGTDQGKTGNVNAIRLMAGLRGVEMSEAGTTTFRPPYTPVSVGALAGRSVGLHFRPTRRSPLHDWHLANGATFIEAGPWLRAWYYAWAGSSVEQAYVEEMKHVRKAVGISDVSTLGKIDVQGPDATEFLNRVYVNGFAKLPVGKARYGVMLNDDASVLDDGTTTRLSPTRYFMTTTTAQAAEVMSWLEFLLQTAWTDLRVQVVSITDEWGGMSIAGPQSRAALERALPGVDVSNAALPHMGGLELQLEGVPLRVLRLSFSGELAYEVYAPANYTAAVWEHLLQSAAPLGMRPYGLEALAALRIEKGHVAGLELDHRTTLDDLGLARMASRDKPFVGRELRQRAVLQAPERWSLVGLECLEPGKRLRGGAILFASGEPLAGHGRGYITSVTWSAELNKFIALGLYSGGLRHEGQEIVCAYPLKSEQVRARIVSPVFLDPKGERLHV
ncbi:MAG: (2Fe-2S)-binding protein, partial [Sinobacteraceae bacterium]|nr:(2Fe-2S)-binding protein [Nevskiaceae bacterium]